MNLDLIWDGLISKERKKDILNTNKLDLEENGM